MYNVSIPVNFLNKPINIKRVVYNFKDKGSGDIISINETNYSESFELLGNCKSDDIFDFFLPNITNNWKSIIKKFFNCVEPVSIDRKKFLDSFKVTILVELDELIPIYYLSNLLGFQYMLCVIETIIYTLSTHDLFKILPCIHLLYRNDETLHVSMFILLKICNFLEENIEDVHNKKLSETILDIVSSVDFIQVIHICLLSERKKFIDFCMGWIEDILPSLNYDRFVVREFCFLLSLIPKNLPIYDFLKWFLSQFTETRINYTLSIDISDKRLIERLPEDSIVEMCMVNKDFLKNNYMVKIFILRLIKKISLDETVLTLMKSIDDFSFINLFSIDEIENLFLFSVKHKIDHFTKNLITVLFDNFDLIHNILKNNDSLIYLTAKVIFQIREKCCDIDFLLFLLKWLMISRENMIYENFLFFTETLSLVVNENRLLNYSQNFFLFFANEFENTCTLPQCFERGKYTGFMVGSTSEEIDHLLEFINELQFEYKYSYQSLKYLYKQSRADTYKQNLFIKVLEKNNITDIDLYFLLPLSVDHINFSVNTFCSLLVSQKSEKKHIISFLSALMECFDLISDKSLGKLLDLPIVGYFNDFTKINSNREMKVAHFCEKMNIPNAILKSRVPLIAIKQANKIDLNFTCESDIYQLTSIQLKDWCKIEPPRKGAKIPNLNFHPPVSTCVIILDDQNILYNESIKAHLDYGGITNYDIFYNKINIDVTKYNTFILWKPSGCKRKFLDTFSDILKTKKPVAISATLLRDNPTLISNLLPKFDDNFRILKWEKFSRFLLPASEETFTLDIPNDTVYNSIPFSIENKEDIEADILLNGERVFACVPVNSVVSIFNFDLTETLEQQDIIKYSKIKHCGSCIVSLLSYKL